MNATWDVHISALEGSRASVFALRSKSHCPLSVSRVSRRLEKLKISFSKPCQLFLCKKKFLWSSRNSGFW